MSREGVELVELVYAAASRRDGAAIYELYDDDVELDASALRLPDRGGVHRGHDGLRAFFRQWHQAWSDVAGCLVRHPGGGARRRRARAMTGRG